MCLYLTNDVISRVPVCRMLSRRAMTIGLGPSLKNALEKVNRSKIETAHLQKLFRIFVSDEHEFVGGEACEDFAVRTLPPFENAPLFQGLRNRPSERRRSIRNLQMQRGERESHVIYIFRLQRMDTRSIHYSTSYLYTKIK